MGLFETLIEPGLQLLSLAAVEVVPSVGGDEAVLEEEGGGLKVLVLVVIREGPVSLLLLEFLVNVLALLDILSSSSSLSLDITEDLLGGLVEVFLAGVGVRVAVSLALGGGTSVPPLLVLMSLFRALLVGYDCTELSGFPVSDERLLGLAAPPPTA